MRPGAPMSGPQHQPMRGPAMRRPQQQGMMQQQGVGMMQQQGAGMMQQPYQVQLPQGMQIPPSFEDLQRIQPDLAAQLQGAQYRGPDGSMQQFVPMSSGYQPTQQPQQQQYPPPFRPQQMPFANPHPFQMQQTPQQAFNQPSTFYGQQLQQLQQPFHHQQQHPQQQPPFQQQQHQQQQHQQQQQQQQQQQSFQQPPGFESYPDNTIPEPYKASKGTSYSF